ncbi:hypothetical protein B4U37_02940 [Sutcliffiella horikoshii]|uniref:Uncharacterized protein n=2 Tax=Sutcliffiella horikoshii TaxID=79883 RepID=A0ABM6KFD8_9BACI|nr:hypothetical protein B4U37_02940 [Sutcliffiella horikoshii]
MRSSLERMVRVIAMPLIVVHLLIAYFWIFNWEKLTTDVGLISWMGSIILGLVIFTMNRKSKTSNQKLSYKIVTATTFMTILLGVFALMIEFITSSMP